MARLNEILVGRFARGLQKVFGIKGTVPVATLAPEIMPVWPQFVGREHRYLDGWFTFWIAAQIAAVAAQNSAFRMRNPGNSNVVAVFERVSFSETVADNAPGVNVRHQPASLDLTTLVPLGNPQRMDPRGQPSATMVLSKQNAAALSGNQVGIYPIPANGPVADIILTDIQEFVVMPGDAFDIITGVNNSSLSVSWLWRERFLEDSERT